MEKVVGVMVLSGLTVGEKSLVSATGRHVGRQVMRRHAHTATSFFVDSKAINPFDTCVETDLV
jgi:hypothetical protein